MMKNKMLILILGCILGNCIDNSTKATKSDNQENKTSINYDDAIVEEYNSYYGFIAKNSYQHNFYHIERNKMLKYLNNDKIDSTDVKDDLLSSKWLSTIEGNSYDYFSWLNFVASDNNIDSLELETCSEKLKMQIIPVYITQLNRKVNSEKAKLDNCNDYFPGEIYSRPSLNMVYIMPLNYEQANAYLQVKDTLSRNKFQKFLKNKVH